MCEPQKQLGKKVALLNLQPGFEDSFAYLLAHEYDFKKQFRQRIV